MARQLALLAVLVGGSTALSLAVKATVLLVIATAVHQVAAAARASIRHALLASAFGALLLLPAVSLLSPRIAIAMPVDRDMEVLSLARLPYSGFDAASPAAKAPSAAADGRRASAPVSLATVLIACWAIGSAACLAPLLLGLAELGRVRSAGRRWGRGAPLVRELLAASRVRRRVDVLLHDGAAVPMTCGSVRPVILLPAAVDAWATHEVEHALVHELEHVRRADWLVSVAARAVCALYWWQPLAWLARRRLNLEAERACDDAVLGRAEATDYARQLVVLARRVSATAPRPALAMIGQSDLSARVAAVLDAGQRRGRAGRVRTAAIASAAIALLVVIAPLQAVFGAQDQAASAAPLPHFEVSSVKPNKSGDFRTNLQLLPSGRLVATNLPLRALVYYAWRLQAVQVDGGPDWAATDRFDIAATFPEGTSSDQARLMLRSLLADRFKLRTHTERRELAVYALTVARADGRLGPSLHKSTADCGSAAQPGTFPVPPPDRNAPCGFMGPAPSSDFPSGRATMAFRGLTMDAFARFWTPALRRMVINRTGLDGYYDGEFEPTAEFGPPPPPPGVPDPFDRANFPSTFTVLRERLGLKLDSTKAPVDVLVIDGAERPAENN